jgi:hypothetical protein
LREEQSKMTMPPSDGTDPTERQRSAAEIDAQFAAIVSAMSGSMSWDTADEPEAAAGSQPAAGTPSPSDSPSSDDRAAQEREQRRAQRKAQRAEEVALFTAAQADAEAALQADEAHFTPPDPPPVPRPGRRTVVALLLMALGLFLLLRPGLLQVGADVVVVLAMTCLVGGFGIMVWGLRPHAGNPDDADGWDDGARL